ncbi:MAG: methyltransferase domain-containing protein [Nanoarchaeota archaeon]
MDISKLFFDLAEIESGGLGIWYEYLSKYRIISKIKGIKTVLVCGLPEKYSIGLDSLYFLTKNKNLFIIDERPNILNKYKKLAKKFTNKKFKNRLVKNFSKLPFKNNSFDLVISTEVLQRYKNNKKVAEEMERVSKKYILCFVPNYYCYAHPKISKLNSLKFKDIKFKNIVKKGYIDIAPWPAGFKLQKNTKKEEFHIKIIKGIMKLIIPMLVKVEFIYMPPIRQYLAHMIYVKAEK